MVEINPGILPYYSLRLSTMDFKSAKLGREADKEEGIDLSACLKFGRCVRKVVWPMEAASDKGHGPRESS